MIQFSSGTTLEPKPVALSNASVIGQARLLNSFWPDTPGCEHRGLSWLPLYHDMGLIGCVFVSLERPGELTLLPPEVFAARPAIWLRAISTYGVTVSPGTNFAYGYCTEQIRDEELEGIDLSSWKVALNGAEPVIGDVMRGFGERFSRWGFDARALAPVYGLAEATLAVTFSEIGRGFSSTRFAREGLNGQGRVVEDSEGREVVSVGRPVPGFEISIRDANRRELGAGEVGHVWARGPTVMDCYLGLPEATHEALHEGWLDTGDLGFFHGGELYVCGRAKELIIVRGKNHSPVEIEQAAESAEGVQSSGAVAVSNVCDNSGREQILLFVERERRLSPEEQRAISDACHTAVLSEVGVDVDRVIVLPPESIPRTSSGKVRRTETLRRCLEGELGCR
jgi:acyl-CoA synthetase (AMP-forming)/AMP-acid ligase II